ncbi:hypothetical protein [Leptospira wolffii]|uniref:hypothetical protein n=1 Tax=Leptospira wolffii TaxID=409998 RepID=UPI0018DC8422|nr:hypothetical protein [Leptospira wolffii]
MLLSLALQGKSRAIAKRRQANVVRRNSENIMYKTIFVLLFLISFPFNAYGDDFLEVLGSGRVKKGNLSSALRINKIRPFLKSKYRSDSAKFYAINNIAYKNIYLMYDEQVSRLCYYNVHAKNEFCETYNGSDGYHYKWYLDLKKNNTMYVLEFDDDEDYADYRISEMNLQNMKKRTLFNILPIAKDGDRLNWGDLDSIQDIILEKKSLPYKLNVALNHRIPIDSAFFEGKGKIPIFFFIGTMTDNSTYKELIMEKGRFMYIDQVELLLKKIEKKQ